MAILGHPAGAVDPAIDTTVAEAVRQGLTQSPKRLPSWLLYDAEGSRLFADIMHLPEYYLTRAEYEILEQYQDDFLRAFQPDEKPFRLVGLGSGDGLKTKILLEHFRSRQARFTYVPVDISGEALRQLTADLRERWPDLVVEPVEDDYVKALSNLPKRPAGTRQVVLFLGSNVGNFTPEEALYFYRELYRNLQPGDLVVSGFDLQKHPAIIHAAYNDEAGLTRAFNLNLLHRLNRELGADFDLAAFDHYETYFPETGEARSYLVSCPAHRVYLKALDLTVSFEAGEIIHTEISRKFSRAGIEQLAAESGFRITAWLTDNRGYFAEVIFEVV